MSEEAAYAAGLFDADGCVSVGSFKQGRQHQLRVQVGMSDPEPLEFLKERWGGTVSRFTHKNRTRVLFNWYIGGGQQVEEFLTDILPHSLGKQAQVLEALRYPRLGYRHHRGEPIPPEIVAGRQQVREALQHLKEERTDV